MFAYLRCALVSLLAEFSSESSDCSDSEDVFESWTSGRLLALCLAIAAGVMAGAAGIEVRKLLPAKAAESAKD